MTLIFVGRASDRIMLRTVGRAQYLAVGNLSFFFSFFSHHIFLLIDNKSLMSLYVEIHIKYYRICILLLLQRSN